MPYDPRTKELIRRKRRLRYLLRGFQGRRCYLCGRLFAPPGDAPVKRGLRESLEHVFPACDTGAERLAGETLLSHAKCNNRKDRRAPHPCEVLYLEAARLFLSTLPPETLEQLP